MLAARSPAADIDATIARGDWWLRLFEALSHQAARRREALTEPRGGPVRGMARAADRAWRGVRLALTAILWLEKILAALAALRLRSASEIAAARLTALDRAKARSDAELRRTAIEGEDENEDDEDWPEWDAPDRETYDRDPRDPLVDALDRRLAAVDPVLVDFDDLGLRETVERICADLGVTPDWDRWEAGEWATEDLPAQAHPVTPTSQSHLRPPVRRGLPGSIPPPADMTPGRRFLADLEAQRWRPRLE